MTTHGSATAREQSPHVNQTTIPATNINALKRRAQAVVNDTSIDAESRAIIRYALEINDPWLPELVQRVDAGENIAESFDYSQKTFQSQKRSTHSRRSFVVRTINRRRHCSC